MLKLSLIKMNIKEFALSIMPKKKKKRSMKTVQKRVGQMLKLREGYIIRLRNGEMYRIVLQKGNSKTGKTVYTVSLIPVADCPNCEGCRLDCYDIHNVCFQPAVQNDRARNSALHLLFPEIFWQQVYEECIRLGVEELRINVGGDLADTDFFFVDQLKKKLPNTDIIFFTKNHSGCNAYLDEKERETGSDKFEDGIHPLLSGFEGMTLDNPHHLPESHILYADGTTTASETRLKHAYFCSGNCSECKAENKGCSSFKQANCDEDVQSVVLSYH